MARKNDAGIFQLEGGGWGYRIKRTINGRKIDTTCRTDETGKPFSTKTAAVDARETRVSELKKSPVESPWKDKLLREIYDVYSQSAGAKSKAFSTIRKQDSIWKNHVEHVFGDKLVSEISLADLENYLQLLYTYGDDYNQEEGGYAYKYVEGFLRFFYLVFGEAYRRDAIDPIRYQKMFLDKGTRLSMPKMTQHDAENADRVRVFNTNELKRINRIMKGGNAYTAFMLGYYLGCRVSECYGLMWSDIDWENGTITIRRQMLYQNNTFCLCPVKTLKAVRTIDMGNELQDYLHDFWISQRENKEQMGDGWKAWEVVLDKTDPRKAERIVGGDFINRTERGELCTINSLKFWAKKIKDEEFIDFQYHSLRRTHATMMANLNTPALELMNRLGHKKYETTMRYYLDENNLAREKLKEKLNSLDFNPRTDIYKSLEDFALAEEVPTAEQVEEILRGRRSRVGIKRPKRSDGTDSIPDHIKNAPFDIDDVEFL